ncbi:hypothetical protein AB205_0004430 [Aquarana catesbeiana]|uniref:Uncharacterized protein n=1 Tax=Aquarana catesbeiana TaxID=8400 RepID=A0A2G9S437_AQUCT|nr:hypothetical protein AB205_0004430 [Aquarana catesbeiana]
MQPYSTDGESTTASPLLYKCYESLVRKGNAYGHQQQADIFTNASCFSHLTHLWLHLCDIVQRLYTLFLFLPTGSDVSGACAVKARLKVRQTLLDLAGKNTTARMRGSDVIVAPATHSAGTTNLEETQRAKCIFIYTH